MKLLKFIDYPNLSSIKADILQNIQANNYQEDIYIRLQGYIDEWGEMAVRSPVSTSIVSYPRPRAIAFTEGKNFTISSWQRLDDNASPPRIKASANYLNSRLASIQAKESGYDGGIMLGPNGKVSEGPGGCIFLIRNGNLITPSITSGILESITRDSIIEIADTLKIKVQTRDVDRTELYIAEEIFYCGTGQEIMPILSVDKMLAGEGTPGKITKTLQSEFTEIVRGNNPIFKSWISPTYKK
jgi:branched-chain amino acid aminotransferase